MSALMKMRKARATINHLEECLADCLSDYMTDEEASEIASAVISESMQDGRIDIALDDYDILPQHLIDYDRLLSGPGKFESSFKSAWRQLQQAESVLLQEAKT